MIKRFKGYPNLNVFYVMAKSSAKEKFDTNCPACAVQFHRSIRLLTLPLTDLAGTEHRRAYRTLVCVLRNEVLRTPGT